MGKYGVYNWDQRNKIEIKYVILKSCGSTLDFADDNRYNNLASGCGEAWYRAWFGSKRPRVQIPTLRP